MPNPIFDMISNVKVWALRDDQVCVGLDDAGERVEFVASSDLARHLAEQLLKAAGPQEKIALTETCDIPYSWLATLSKRWPGPHCPKCGLPTFNVSTSDGGESAVRCPCEPLQ